MVFRYIFFLASFLVYRIVLTDVLSTGGVASSEECLSLAILLYKFLIVSIKTW